MTTHSFPIRAAIASLPLAFCAGCDMLGALFDESTLRGIVLVVVIAVALAFIVSRATKR